MLDTGAKQLPKMAEVLPFSIFLPLLCFLVVETKGTELGEDVLKLRYFFCLLGSRTGKTQAKL